MRLPPDPHDSEDAHAKAVEQLAEARERQRDLMENAEAAAGTSGEDARRGGSGKGAPSSCGSRGLGRLDRARDLVTQMDDDAIRALVIRLSRAHPSGGDVIGRAAIMAEGADFNQVVRWIIDHDGQPEPTAPAKAGRGLHRSRLTDAADGAGAPVRYVLPAGALVGDEPRS